MRRIIKIDRTKYLNQGIKIAMIPGPFPRFHRDHLYINDHEYITEKVPGTIYFGIILDTTIEEQKQYHLYKRLYNL